MITATQSLIPIGKKYAACLGLILLTAFTTPTINATPTQQQAWTQELRDAVLRELKDSGTPSLQVSIAHEGRVIFEAAFGLADLENDVAATPTTKYRTASVSKWLTATAVMQLVEQKELNLDTPIQVYCPHFPVKKFPITTRELLTHTSGIRHYVDYDSELATAKSTSERIDIERRRDRELIASYTRFTSINPTLKNFERDYLLFEPGSNWSYSSFGYRVLACVMEGAAKQPYRVIVQENIFEPLGMKNTLSDDAWAIIPNRASGYRLSKDKHLRRADMRDVSENLPAGGHLSTATDLVMFAQAFADGKLVSEQMAQMMYQPTADRSLLSRDPTWRDAIPSKEEYGYGIMLFPDAGKLRIGHTGRQAGGSAIVCLLPEQRLSIAVMTNAKGWNGYISFLGAIQDILERTIL